jgi:hypothetical protein
MCFLAEPNGGKMQVYCNGTALIRHHDTGQIHEIESDELDWDVIGSDDRQMGPEFHHEASVEHPDLGVLTWALWEYPLGAENYRETKVGPHELVEDFDYGLEHEQPDPDEWLDLTPPDDPYSIFLSSFRDTGPPRETWRGRRRSPRQPSGVLASGHGVGGLSRRHSSHGSLR